MATKLTPAKGKKATPKKAKGAGGAKGGTPSRAAALKPPPHAPTPQRPAPAPPGDNRPPTEDQVRAHRKERLAALTQQHRQQDNKIEIKRAEMDELVSVRSTIRNAIHNLGYPLDEFDRSYKDLKLKTKKVDLEKREVYRDEIREVHGHPTLKQLELDLAQPRPEAANVAMYWRGIGYQDGIQGFACDPVKAGCPPEATQDYMAGHGDGQTIIGAGMKRLRDDEPVRGAAPLIADGRPDWTTWSADHTTWSDEEKERFDTWYETVPVGETPDLVGHVGAAARFAWLEAEEKRLAGGGETGPAAEAPPPAPDGDGFEATAEELAKQAGRRTLDEDAETAGTA